MNSDRAPFLQVPLDLFSDPALNDGDLRVYCTVLSFADFGTLADCRPGLVAIAGRAGKDKSTVARSLARLESSGWLARERRTLQGKECDTTLYSFPRHSLGLLHQRDNLVAPARQPSRTSATGVVAPVRQGVVAPVRQNLEPCTKSHDLEDPPAPSVHAPQGGLPLGDQPASKPRPTRGPSPDDVIAAYIREAHHQWVIPRLTDGKAPPSLRKAVAEGTRREPLRDWSATFREMALSGFLAGKRPPVTVTWCIGPRNLARWDAGDFRGDQIDYNNGPRIDRTPSPYRMVSDD